MSLVKVVRLKTEGNIFQLRENKFYYNTRVLEGKVAYMSHQFSQSLGEDYLHISA